MDRETIEMNGGRITLDLIKKDEEIGTYIEYADKALLALGYTEHGKAHITTVAARAARIIALLGKYDEYGIEREAELTAIAGYMHDIGNMVNRVDHSQSGAIIAFRILERMGMQPPEIAKIVTAIGNHDEGTGVPVSDIAAALIIADKTDVRRTRVRNSDNLKFDIHDRVNYSVTRSDFAIDRDEREIILSLTIDTEIGTIMEYFEIFLERMKLCRSAAEALGATFILEINKQKFT